MNSFGDVNNRFAVFAPAEEVVAFFYGIIGFGYFFAVIELFGCFVGSVIECYTVPVSVKIYFEYE